MHKIRDFQDLVLPDNIRPLYSRSRQDKFKKFKKSEFKGGTHPFPSKVICQYRRKIDKSAPKFCKLGMFEQCTILQGISYLKSSFQNCSEGNKKIF